MVEELTVRLKGRLCSARVAVQDPATDRCVEMMDSAQKLMQQAQAREASVAQSLQALRQATQQFQAVQSEFFREAEEQLVDLAVDIARKILAQEINAGRYEIDPIVREALAGVEGCREIVVRLNPIDHENCTIASSESQSGEGHEGLQLVADPGIPLGGCVLETQHGRIESLVDDQLNEVHEAMKAPE